MKNRQEVKISLKTIQLPGILLLVFLTVAVWRWQATGRIFYLFNFSYIGISAAVGLLLMSILPRKQKPMGRRITQLLIGCYMLFYLGFINKENMQIEGFFIYLFLGVFAGATLHYFVAKVAGPLIFGRGWCGYACWTAMVLDFLPHKQPQNGRIKGSGIIRYVHFFLSLGLSLVLWKVVDLKFYNGTMEELYFLIAGNLLYYAIGIALALKLKDNRAFCKYVCPIPVLQKITASFSLMKMRINEKSCTNCGICERVCPMDIKIMEYKRSGGRVHSTECIACATCINTCPKGALGFSFKWAPKVDEKIGYCEAKVYKKGKVYGGNRNDYKD